MRRTPLTTAPRRQVPAHFNHFAAGNVSSKRYDTRCYFNVRSKADMSQLNLRTVNLTVRASLVVAAMP